MVTDSDFTGAFETEGDQGVIGCLGVIDWAPPVYDDVDAAPAYGKAQVTSGVTILDKDGEVVYKLDSADWSFDYKAPEIVKIPDFSNVEGAAAEAIQSVLQSALDLYGGYLSDLEELQNSVLD